MGAWFGLLLVALAGAAAVVSWLLLRRRASPDGGYRVPYVVDFVQFWGLVAIVIASIASVARTVIALLPGAAISVRTPIELFWPQPFPGVEIGGGPTATVISGGISQADLVLEDLALGTRALLAGGALVQGAVFVIVTLAVVQLCRALRRREPFGPRVTRSGRIAALTVGIGGVLWQLLFSIGQTIAAREALQITSWMSTNPDALDPADPSSTGLPLPGFDITIEFAPIAIALAIWVVAELIAAGARMQGENHRLRADTEGLV